MRPAIAAILIHALLSAPPVAGADDGERSALRERHQAILREYGRSSVEFRNAGTDAARNAAIERLAGFAPRFLELAEKGSRDPVALEALLEAVRAMNAVDSLIQTAWELNSTSFPAPGQSDTAARITAVLVRDHLRSDGIGLICQRMTYGMRKEYESFLRAVQEENPHREVKALACLALSDLLGTRLQKLDLIEDRPELIARYEDLLGRESFQEWRRRGRGGIAREVESLLERAVAEYGDVKHPYDGTVGEKAQASLLERRRLAPGQEAPDIEGEDQEGKRFKLSDYRRKVVLLDFWQEH